MGLEVISMQDVDVMITLCGVTLRALNPSDVTLLVVVWRRK